MKNKVVKVLVIAIILILITSFTFMMGFNFLLRALILVMTVDYILGIGLGILGNSKHGKGLLSSKIGFKGILKKLTILLLVGIAFLITVYLAQYNINFKYATDVVITTFFINEVISIL